MSARKPWAVVTYDNHAEPGEDRPLHVGDYETLDEAVAAAKAAVDQALRDAGNAVTAEERVSMFKLYGEEPVVRGPAPSGFDARAYAEMRARELFPSSGDKR
ncbi:MAG: hypothetical protein AB7P21_07075 [Lautropia sp.]